jgi:tetratricopeptide (TPR) repeat protein
MFLVLLFFSLNLCFSSNPNLLIKELEEELQDYKEQKMKSVEDYYYDETIELENFKREERKKAIKDLEKLKQEKLEVNDKADILYKLGQLYFEEESEEFVLKVKNFENDYRKHKEGKITKKPKEPKLEYPKTFNVLKPFLKTYDSYFYKDNALYILCYISLKEDNINRAINISKIFERKYKNSKNYAEVFSMIGEFFFVRSENRKSLFYYRKVLEMKNSSFYENAIYKISWLHSKLKNYDNSNNYAVKYLNICDKNYGKNFFSISKEEVKDVLAYNFYSQRTNVFKISEFFKIKTKKDYEYDVLIRYLKFYLDNNQKLTSKKILNFIINKFPKEENNHDIYISYLNILDLNKRVIKSDYDNYYKIFSKNSLWRKSNLKNKKIIQTSDNNVAKIVFQAANYYYYKAAKSKENSLYKDAAKWYQRIIENYPKSKYFLSASCEYANIMFINKKYKQSLVFYLKTDSHFQDGSEKALFGAFVSQNKILENNDLRYKNENLEATKTSNKILNRQEKILLEISKKYEKRSLNKTNYSSVVFKKAEVFYRNAMFNKARNEYVKIIKVYGAYSSESKEAIRSIIASYNKEGNYLKEKKWSDKLKNLENKKDSYLALKKAKKILNNKEYQVAKEYENKGLFFEAASSYERISKNSKDEAAALYKAANLYENQGLLNHSIPCYLRIINKFKKSFFYKYSIYNLALNYESTFDLDKALKWYSFLIEEFSYDKIALISTCKRSYVYNAKSDYLNSYKDQIKCFSNKKDKTDDDYYFIINLLLKINLIDKAIFYSNEYIKSDKTKFLKEILFILTDLYFKSKKYIKMEETLDFIDLNFKDTLTFQKGKFKRNEVLLNSVLNTKITDVNSYNNKISGSRKLIKNYSEIIEKGLSVWTITSYYKIAVIYENIYKNLKTLNNIKKNKEFYSILNSYKKEKNKYYQKVINKTEELELINKWFYKAKEKLNSKSLFLLKEKARFLPKFCDLKSRGCF